MMYRALIIPFLFSILYGCAQKSEKLIGIIVELKYPIMDTVINNRWEVRDYGLNFTRMYFYNDLIMIQPSYTLNTIEMVNGVVINETPEVRVFKTFVYSNNFQKCIMYDSNSIKSARIVKKDSVQTAEWIFKDIPDEIFKGSHFQLISSQKSKKGNLTELYSIVNKTDTTTKGSCRLVFSNNEMESIPYHLSKSNDKRKKMRMTEFSVIINASDSSNGHLPINSMEISYKLSELKVANEQELKQMFEFAKMNMGIKN